MDFSIVSITQKIRNVKLLKSTLLERDNSSSLKLSDIRPESSVPREPNGLSRGGCRAGIRTPILAFKGRCPTVRRPGNNYTNLKNHVPTSSLSISQSRAFYKTYEMVKNLCDSISFSPLHPLFVRIRGVGRECNGRIYHDHRSSGVVVNETLQDKDYSKSLRALILMLCRIPTPASMTTKLDPPYETNGRVMPVIGTTPMFMPIWMKLCEKTSAANPIL